jgi:hypothetical protein
MPLSLLEQARCQAKGQNGERNDWNEVTVGDKTFTMEYPLNKNQNSVNKEEIAYTFA